MPLPKPPSKKGDLLKSADYEAQAAPRADKRSPRPGPPKRPRRPRWTCTTAGDRVPHRVGPVPRHARPRQRGTKLFVLDTNVLMHDPMCLFRFEEHDIFLPMIVLEELDGHKKGMTEVARNARQVSRDLDALAAPAVHRGRGHRHRHRSWTPPATAKPAASCSSRPSPGLQAAHQPAAGQGRQPDPGRGAEATSPRRVRWCWCPRTSTCASRRVPWAWPAEDYQNDKTLEDGDLLYTGVAGPAGRLLGPHGKTMESWQQGGHTFYRISGPVVPSLLINQFVYFEAPGEPSCMPA
jgi:PhoH-like ATPase